MECPSVYGSEANLRDQYDIGRKRFVKQNTEALPSTTLVHQMNIWEEEEEPNLPMSDRGFLAWRFLVVLFILEGLLWAPPLSFGVFLNYSPYSEMSRTLAASTGEDVLVS
ncbi:hypothetical protein CROQUDRAFT_86462 [Cronartium quercuum f. sp. fusiforme G11]|uniref:Uncharacterized protein n=1 Tax=Cronartium quercuum f. sp. fusiforme G11 TaxID=708437 RepID=A0A9P6NR27_9BASI|nr:hypothetical protein CROQUDRAFT_86462 [Cronartium quercuum f. sp. fusiforme G11]